MASDAQLKIEAYLAVLRRCLRGLSEEDTRDIVEELRGHIQERMASNGETTAGEVDKELAALGTPEALASEYLTDALLARAEMSRSPWQMLATLFRWASLSVAGLFVLLVCILGYVVGIVLILIALLKPFHSHTAGMWVSRDITGDLSIFLRLGFGSAPAVGREVLGWSIIPIGFIAGFGLVILTTRFGLWCMRQYRKSRGLPWARPAAR